MSISFLLASIILQFTVAVVAVIIVIRTGSIRGWMFLAAGFVLMFFRRLVSLHDAVSAGNVFIDPNAESIALITSFLLLLGVILLSGAFTNFRNTGMKLKHELEEKEKTRQELEEREREHRTLVNNLPGFAYRCANEKNWTMKFISTGCLDITGYSPEEFIDNRIIAYNDIIDPEYREGIWNKWQSVLSKKDVFQGEYPIVTKNGSRRWVWEKGCGVFSDEGELLFLEGFIADVTERRKAEEELQKVEKLASVGTLAGGIAHDFNNIMTGVFGNISMALEHIPAESRGSSYIRLAERSMERATKLTQQLLTFARGGEPVFDKTDLRSLVEETVRLDLSGSKVEPFFSWDEDLWHAEADRSQLQQVFSNLALNADQAMPQGGRLEITGSNFSSYSVELLSINPGDYVKIVFKDFGCGIPTEDLEKVFDPYFSTKTGGTGLGLATVHSVIRRHGGRITVSSEVGEGTEFIILLPAVPESAKISEGTGDNAFPGARGLRIMVMDDEEVVRDVAQSMLEHLGYTVETIPDGKKAVERYIDAHKHSNPFDLIIMDLTIPGGMGGAEAMKEILKFDPDAKAIVSSGYSESPVMSNYSAFGFSGVMAKPYTIQKLRETLLQVLGTV